MNLILIVLLISIVLPVVPVQARDAWHNGPQPYLGRSHGDITMRDPNGNLIIGDYDLRTGDLFLYNTKTGHITDGTRGRNGDLDIREYKGFDLDHEDD